jgi:prolyl-tRNA synthetase
MSHVPLYASRLFPPPRPRSGGQAGQPAELLEALGFVGHTDAAGVHTLLPLGLRVRDQLDRIARDAFERAGFSTLAFPTLQSRALWEQTGRWKTYTSEGTLFTVQSGAEELCLAPTSEEIAAATVRAHLRSYRDLPVRLSLTTQKFRNELSPRGGLMRGREFTMADAYTFDASHAGMMESTRLLNQACTAALVTMGMHGVFQAPADGGAISAGPSTEHLVLAPFGQGTILACDHCGNRGDAAVISGTFPDGPQGPEPVVNVITFAVTSADGAVRPAAVCIRSDLTVSTRKLTAALEARNVAILDPSILPGLLGKPAGTLTPWDCLDIDVVYDASVASLKKFTIADGPDGLRHGASWSGGNGHAPIAPAASDVHAARAGLPCGRCAHGRYQPAEAVEVAHVFELGTWYTKPMGVSYTADDGNSRTPLMACSGIGLTRCIQTLAGLYRDSKGLRWKQGTGPADIHMTVMRADLPGQQRRAADLAAQLARHDARLLIDDRPLPAGEKFHFAESLGIPAILVLSPRQDSDEAELTDRWTGRRTTVNTRELDRILDGSG